jgi:hypothetical protein
LIFYRNRGRPGYPRSEFVCFPGRPEGNSEPLERRFDDSSAEFAAPERSNRHRRAKPVSPQSVAGVTQQPYSARMAEAMMEARPTIAAGRSRGRLHFVPSSFGTICISWISRPTVEWKETDYDVVGDGVPVGRISTMSGTNFSLD